jgi:hypothetical protein
MNDDQAVTTLAEVAVEWAGEYGWGNPEDALAVLRAVYQLRPNMIPDVYYDAVTTLSA